MLQFKGGDIDEEMFITQIVGHPTPTFHVQNNLALAFLRRDVHGHDGLLAEQAFGFKAMAGLETAHRDGKVLIKVGGVVIGPLKIPRERKQVAHIGNARIIIAGLGNGTLRQIGPSHALINHGGINLEHLFQGLVVNVLGFKAIKKCVGVALLF